MSRYTLTKRHSPLSRLMDAIIMVSLLVFLVRAPVVESTPNSAIFRYPFMVVSSFCSTSGLITISSSGISTFPTFSVFKTPYNTTTISKRTKISTINSRIFVLFFLERAFALSGGLFFLFLTSPVLWFTEPRPWVLCPDELCPDPERVWLLLACTSSSCLTGFFLTGFLLDVVVIALFSLPFRFNLL